MLRNFLTLSWLLLLLSSCASILNSRKDIVLVTLSRRASISLKGDSARAVVNGEFFTVPRSRQPLTLVVSKDSLQKEVLIKANNSFAYYLNFYPYFLPGLLVDRNNPKRFSYPGNVYIDLDRPGSGYTTKPPLDSSLLKLNSLLKINPFRAFLSSNSAFELTYELKTSKRFTSQISAAYLFPANVLFPDLYDNVKGFRIGLEEKFFFRGAAPRGGYLACEADYLQTSYRTEWNFYSPDTYNEWDEIGYVDDFSVDKKTFSFNAKYGYQFLLNRFSIDLFAGLGLRYRSVKHSDRSNPSDRMIAPRHPNVHYFNNKEGNSVVPNFPLGMRLGWFF